MKSWEKQLPSKANIRTFLSLTALILGQNSVKDIKVTKIVKEIKFEGVWGELELKKTLQRQ